MRRLTSPKVSGVHRFACLALYRALLRQCSGLSNTTPAFGVVMPMIQNKFHNHKKIQSPSRALNAMNAGYEALDLIHFASQGRQHETESLLTLISDGERAIEFNKEYQRERTKAKPLKPLTKKEKRKQGTRDFEKATARRHPDATPILSRPRPVVSGKRRVPIFVNARGVPFLRIKKPQPMNLSGVIRSKLDNRWKRIERRDRLETASVIAEGEDLWDQMTLGQKEVSWANEVQSALKAVNDKIAESDAKNKKLAEDMWQVVLAERKLAAEEAVEEDSEKNLKTASTDSKLVKQKTK